jgi:quercetin dioxygenase-like cupin family protein
MQLRKYRWSRHYESAEEELLGMLDSKNIQAERWEAEEGQDIDLRALAEDTHLWCAEGSMVVHIDGKNISMQPGDTLDIPANTPHKATAGMTGVVCYEATPKV